jgi:hypothetical protein
LRKAVEKLREQQRTFVHLQYNGEHVWLVRSSSSGEDQDVEALWRELKEGDESRDPMFVFRR